MKALLIVAVLVLAATVTSVAPAKDFGPGDLRVCNSTHCVPVEERSVLPLLGSFYYGANQPKRAHAPRLGARALELRFRNGYVTGIVASARLDRFLSYGVNLGRFRRGRWYRLPAAVSREFQALSVSVQPFRLTRARLAESR